MSEERKASVGVFQPSIKITISGLLAIFSRNTSCQVGFLKKTHHPHKLEVKVTEIDMSGSKDITPPALKDPLKLIVTPPQGIRLRKFPMQIDRMVRPNAGDENEDSFAWAVDLENKDEFYKKEIGAKKAGFKPFLIFDSGELFTAEISRNMLERQDPGESFKHFGFVAVKIGVHIPLDQPNVKAVLMNGSDPTPVFKSQTNMRYEVVVDRGPVRLPTGTTNDAESYYLDKAIGGKLKDSEKIHFRSTVERAGPEAACFVASLSKSDPN